jgi:outer membrane protein TolC
LDARVRAFVAAPAFDEFRLDDGTWDIGLNLRWRLFDGLSRPARTRQAEAMVKVMRARDERATRMVQLEVMTAYTNLEGAVSRLGTAKTALEQAKEALRLVTIEREGGAATLTRYLQTQSAETEARMRLAAARFDVRKARADVARSLGRFAEPNAKRASTDAEDR